MRGYLGDIEAGRLPLPLDVRAELDGALADNPSPRVQASRRRIVGHFTEEGLLLQLPETLGALGDYLEMLKDQELTARVEGDDTKAQAIVSRHKRLYRLHDLLETELGGGDR